MIDNYLVGLQNDVDVEKDMPGLCSETCPVSSQDAAQVESMKVEEEEDGPVLITWDTIKAEHEVSLMLLWTLLSRFDKYTKLHIVFLCLSVCPSVSLLETNLW
jgi:hypothetical protein